MSIREQFPADRGNVAAQGVHQLLAAAARALDSIEPFGTDIPADAMVLGQGLADAARGAIRDGSQNLATIRSIEGIVAALKAAEVNRMMEAVAVESAATKLTRHQAAMAGRGCVAEIALALCIPERTAVSLIHRAQQITTLPLTRTALGDGAISWRHATTVMQELSTLDATEGLAKEAPGLLEWQLLRLAEGCTPLRFASKARKARETMFPESLETRTREAFRRRSITNVPGRDGMSCIELRIPTIAANAIMVHCTRAARAIKADALARQREADAAGTGQDCIEHRTLNQLRADVAAQILMGQELPDSAHYTPPTTGHGETNTWYGATRGDQDTTDPTGDPATTNWYGTPTDATTTWYGSTTTGSGRAGDAWQGRDGIWEGGDGSGYRQAAVDATRMVEFDIDGVREWPWEEWAEQDAYLEELRRLGHHPVLADPPLPMAQVVVKVGYLGLLGLTDEPAELDAATDSPVPLSIARKLLGESGSFLRALTDPVTGEMLPLKPDKYTITDHERSVLQVLAGGCYFPNCTNPVLDTEMDHVKSFESGGQSTMANLRPACRLHHALKHFKDDKDRHGNYRRWAEPWRTGLRLHGWTPNLCDDGRVGWTSPSGKYHPPEYNGPLRPSYPKWLKKRIQGAVDGNAAPAMHQEPAIRPTFRVAHYESPLEARIVTYLATHAA